MSDTQLYLAQKHLCKCCCCHCEAHNGRQMDHNSTHFSVDISACKERDIWILSINPSILLLWHNHNDCGEGRCIATAFNSCSDV